ncbi:hypothetical protein ERJ75_000254700 [Trypanosoma vivax]|nr:hypothetical protein ERJ75_000254700 [Trypanosoma vivax]
MCIGCRGILIAALTNRARTQMAEGALRSLTAGTVFIKSGGVHHEGALHPLAIKVMQDVGVDISGQSVTSLESARRQQTTYDVYISVDCSYKGRSLDRSLKPISGDHLSGLPSRCSDAVCASDANCEDNVSDVGNVQCSIGAKENNYVNNALYHCNAPHHDDDGEFTDFDPFLVPSTPSHWSVGADAADVRRRWEIWSPRDPSIFHERSTRKFQDHLYEGEPLFMRLRQCTLRTRAKISERWEVDEIATRYAVERHCEQEFRFVHARDIIVRHCATLLSRLEKHYDAKLLLDRSLVDRLA